MARNNYPTDLTDEPWGLVRPLRPRAKPGGRPRPADLRYHRRRLDGTWDRGTGVPRTRLRHADGRKESLSAAIVDGQTVRTAEGASAAATPAAGRITTPSSTRWGSRWR